MSQQKGLDHIMEGYPTLSDFARVDVDERLHSGGTSTNTPQEPT